ncbi:hypothetical protein G9A89_017303 [Geosiphon pyriformis]|nr:hypothetical protein G9A89_017303 [Geosiphon pyriformis]
MNNEQESETQINSAEADSQNINYLLPLEVEISNNMTTLGHGFSFELENDSVEEVAYLEFGNDLLPAISEVESSHSEEHDTTVVGTTSTTLVEIEAPNNLVLEASENTSLEIFDEFGSLISQDIEPYECTADDLILISDLLALYEEMTRAVWDNVVVKGIKDWIIRKKQTEEHIFKLLQTQFDSPKCLCLLGFFFHFGIGVSSNYQNGFSYYSLAAKKGDVFALIQVGESYEKAFGTEYNKSTAIEYYKRAALHGHPQGFFNYGIYMTGKEQLMWLRKSADYGFLPGILRVVEFHHLGAPYLVKDKHEALRLALRYHHSVHSEGPIYPVFCIFKNVNAYFVSYLANQARNG